MKKASLTPILAALVAAIAFIAVPKYANAGHEEAKRQVSTCSSCGHGVYAYPQLVGRESCGAPIYRWVTAPHTGCSQNHGSSGHAHQGSSHYSSQGGSHYRSPSSRQGYSSGYSRGPSFSLSFGRSSFGCR